MNWCKTIKLYATFIVSCFVLAAAGRPYWSTVYNSYTDSYYRLVSRVTRTPLFISEVFWSWSCFLLRVVYETSGCRRIAGTYTCTRELYIV